MLASPRWIFSPTEMQAKSTEKYAHDHSQLPPNP